MEHKGNGLYIFAIVVIAAALVVVIDGATNTQSDNVGYAPAKPLQILSCYKPGGFDVYNRGTATYNDGYGLKRATDYCRNYVSNTLVEYNCSGVRLVPQDITCLYGCWNGACNKTKSTSTCGNDIIETGEQCDGNDLRMSCVDLGFKSGNIACSANCSINTTGCSNILPSKCGNNIIETGEQCDGNDLRMSCVDLGFKSGNIACYANCSINTTGCSNILPSKCGNNIIETGEQCDGNDLRMSCVDLGFKSGNIACYANCSINTTGCSNILPSKCGNNIIETGEQCDGRNLGGLTCRSLGYASGTLNCTTGCRYNTQNCMGMV